MIAGKVIDRDTLCAFDSFEEWESESEDDDEENSADGNYDGGLDDDETGNIQEEDSEGNDGGDGVEVSSRSD